MKRLLCGLYLKIKAFVISVSQINKVHLMDEVIYDGKRCFVNNGTSAPVWDLYEDKANEKGIRNTYRVHEKDFKKVRSFRNIKNDMFHHYNWYMMYWYKIDLNKICGYSN